MSIDLTRLEKKIGITFNNRTLFQQAFTHTSYAYEGNNQGKYPDNQRLEYLGDAVLELVVSDYLYHRYPEMSEGSLTKVRSKIVCEASLAAFARELDFGKYLQLGTGEEKNGGRTRPSILSDAFEAFLGALYLDQGIKIAKQFLHKQIFPKVDQDWLSRMTDVKSRLQELIQQEQLGVLDYRIVDVKGPPHKPQFVAELYLNEKCLGKGTGRTKKEAEEQAAGQALTRLKKG